MRVCLYTESALPRMGGQEMVVDALARQYLGLGNQVVVLAPRPTGRSPWTDKDLPYAVIRHPRFISTRRWIDWYARYLAKTHRQYPFDILHCHSVYPTGYLAARCSKVERVPVVITSHCGDVCPSSPLLGKPSIRPRYGVALRRADAVIAISDFTDERLRYLCPDIQHLVRIPNGVEADRLATPVRRPGRLHSGIRSKSFFLFLGRLVQRKGVDLLLEAFAQTAGPRNHHVVIGGTGSEESNLREQAHKLAIHDRVVFVGQVSGDTKTWLLQNSLCAVMPSRISEGFPLVLLESCAAGRPVIGTEIPGLKGLVQSGQTGLLVPPDSVEGIQRAMTLLSKNPEMLERMGQNARRMATQFDWQNVAISHLQLYHELLTPTSLSKAA